MWEQEVAAVYNEAVNKTQ